MSDKLTLVVDGEVFDWWSRGGIRRIYSEVLPRLSVLAPDVAVTIAVRSCRGLKENGLCAMGQTVPHVPEQWRPWRLWRLAARSIDPVLSYDYWKNVRADVFHPTYYRTRPVTAPSFCFVHDMICEMFPESFDPTLAEEVCGRKRAAVMRAKRVLCNSRRTREDLVRLLGVREDRCSVVYLGGWDLVVDNEAERSTIENERVLLYVGDFWTRYKNFEFVLDCLGGALCKEFCAWQLLVVSSRGPSREERLRYEGKLPGNRIRFVTGVADAELARLYTECSAFVCPSLYEGFGIPVVEALSVGAPVLCSMAGALPEIGGDVVEYFDPRSPAEFATALRRTATVGWAPDAVRRRKKYARQFSWEQTAEGFVKAVRETASGV